jgi:alpha-mannosidase
MKDKTLYMIGNAHIDPVWLWRWQEGFHEVKATFRSALDRMNEYPEFIFVSSSAAFYEWVENSDPEMFAEIRLRVGEGRWIPVGGWWIEPDCNLPNGESFVRQALYGQRYFHEKFGRTARVGFNVDSFGHHAMLPQILKKSGLDYYVFMRPMPHEKGLPDRLFWWESGDGSRVLAFRLPYEYCTWGQGLENHVMRCADELKAPLTSGLCFYGVGNHGGGPTRENLDSLRRMAGDPSYPEIVQGSIEAWFDSLQANGFHIPVVHDELQRHASGCYSAHSGVKRWNRRAENLLLAAEKFACIAGFAAGQSYPQDLDRAWKNVLFNQFHDILAGTSLEQAYEDAGSLYGEASAIAGRGLNYALQALAWKIRIDPEPGMTPIVVFNPHAWQSRVNVEVEIGLLPEGVLLVDDNELTAPFQHIQPEAMTKNRCRISFVANLPPLGYRTYRLRPARPDLLPAPVEGMLEAGDNFLENDRFRLEFDNSLGGLSRLYDKTAGVEVLAGTGALPVVLEDDSDAWGHNVYQFNRRVGQMKVSRMRLVEFGQVRAVMRVFSEYGDSRLVQDFSLYRGLDLIEVLVRLDWREQFKALKLRFPLNLTHIRATGEIPYGHIERFANGAEEPGQSWVDVSGMARTNGAPYGLSLLNDGKYGFDVDNCDIGLTVLRSPIYAHHVPIVPDPDGLYAFIDQGPQRFRYALLPHTGGWERAGVVQRAAELNQSPFSLIAAYHPEGSLPQSASFLSTGQANIVATVLKKAEDNDDLIVRCVETHKEATRASICLPWLQRIFEADFGPCEIKTFRIPIDHRQPVSETGLLEWTEANDTTG